MQLGTKVKALRKKLHMSQKEVAKASGITQATLSRIEAGKVQQLKSYALGRLAASLHVTVDHLLGERTSMTAADVLKADGTITEFIELYQGLDTTRREEVRQFMRFLISASPEREM